MLRHPTYRTSCSIQAANLAGLLLPRGIIWMKKEDDSEIVSSQTSNAFSLNARWKAWIYFNELNLTQHNRAVNEFEHVKGISSPEGKQRLAENLGFSEKPSLRRFGPLHNLFHLVNSIGAPTSIRQTDRTSIIKAEVPWICVCSIGGFDSAWNAIPRRCETVCRRGRDGQIFERINFGNVLLPDNDN